MQDIKFNEQTNKTHKFKLNVVVLFIADTTQTNVVHVTQLERDTILVCLDCKLLMCPKYIHLCVHVCIYLSVYLNLYGLRKAVD